VLYEMLTGRGAFAGDGVTDTLSRVLQREPDYAVLPATTPPAIRRLLVRCLEKDRNKRLPQIAVAAFQLDEVMGAGSSPVVEAPVRVRRHRAVLGSAILAGVVAGAALMWLIAIRQPASVAPVTRLQMNVSPADQIGGFEGRPTRHAFALSPDGRTLVFSATQKNRRALYLRPLDQPIATVIPGTDEALSPFFSPDGQWIGFWAAGQIRKVQFTGAPPVVIAPLGQMPFGMSWDRDNRVVFARSAGGLMQVPASGGTPQELTSTNTERGEISHRLPHVLPDGDGVLYTVTHNRFPRWDEPQVWLHSRTTGVSKLLIEGGADARYVSSGHLVYARDGVLLAVAFDLKRLEVIGGPVGVIADVMQVAYHRGEQSDTGSMQLSVSASGTLVYLAGGVHPNTEYVVVQVDRTGRVEPLPIPHQAFRTLRRSPDGSQLALSTTGRDRGIWVYNFARGALSRLAGATRGVSPVWTPDGERITYAGGVKGPDSIHWARADGGGSSEQLVSSPGHLVPGNWSPNGRQLFYYSIPGGPSDKGPTIWVQEIGEKSAPKSLAPSALRGGGIDVSPDGQWVAYHSAESGVMQVYVDAYPGPGPRHQVSTNGGAAPIWRADGSEIFYARAPAGEPIGAGDVEIEIMAVPVTRQPTLAFGRPRRLFAGVYSVNGPARGFDVMPDGQRFLLLQPRPHPPDVLRDMTIVQNWIEELRGVR
jgi:Tol biopolymer transport system component